MNKVDISTSDKKKAINAFIRDLKIVPLPDNFTGQVILTLNYNVGGLCAVEREVKDVIK